MSLKVLGAQLNLTAGNLAGNAQLIRDAYARGQKQGVDIVLTPELSLVGYGVEDLLLEKDFLQKNQEAANKLAAITDEKTVLIFGFVQSENIGYDALSKAHQSTEEKPFNAVAVAWGGKIQTIIQKAELPNYGVFNESRWFQSGQQGCFEWKGFKIAVPICADLWSEKTWAFYQQQKPDVILVPNASTYEIGKQKHRVNKLIERAESSGAALIYVNCVGGQDEVIFDGSSMVVAPNSAALLATAAMFQEDDLYMEIGEEGGVFASSKNRQPALSEDAQLYSACVLSLRDFFGKKRQKAAILGLSGGIDSALVAAFAVDALGAKNVTGFMLPYDFTSAASQQDATAIAHNFGINFQTVPIEKMVSALDEVFCDAFDKNLLGTAHENAQSRSRALFLMAVSNSTGSWLLATGNKSEIAVGYATLYGDMCGAFNPVKDLYKTQVFALARWRNSAEAQRLFGAGTIPEQVITKPPTAELRAGQKDEDSLPPYDVLDQILYQMIEAKKSMQEIVTAGFQAETVQQVWQLVKQSEFKRRQAPPGARVSAVSFVKNDRQYPLTQKVS